MQDPLTLEAAASAIQAGHDDAVRADQHRVPPEGEAITHSLTTEGTVAVWAKGKYTLDENSYNQTFFDVQSHRYYKQNWNYIQD